MTEITTLSAQANTDLGHAADVIRRVYKQVFGNKHLMELDVNESLEALFINGDLSVQGLVTALAQSDTYKRLFLEPNSPYRFVELNFKHLLGRAPLNQAEVQNSIKLQAEEGFDALIDSLTDCAEYTEVFGSDIVPYARTADSYAGMYTSSFNMMRELASTKVAVSDNAQGKKARTTSPLALAAAKAVQPVAFTYRSITRTPVKLPEQQYSGQNPPKVTDYVPFRPFGVHF